MEFAFQQVVLGAASKIETSLESFVSPKLYVLPDPSIIVIPALNPLETVTFIGEAGRNNARKRPLSLVDVGRCVINVPLPANVW